MKNAESALFTVSILFWIVESRPITKDASGIVSGNFGVLEILQADFLSTVEHLTTEVLVQIYLIF